MNCILKQAALPPDHKNKLFFPSDYKARVSYSPDADIYI